MHHPASTSERGRAADGILIALVAFAVYLLLGQQTFYKIDGQITLLRLVRDLPPHASHLLGDALARAFLVLTAPLDLSVYDTIVAYSAFSMSAAVLVLHQIARLLRLTRLQAAAATAMFAAAPAALFYATIVEFHGPFMLWASLTLFSATWLALRPRWWVAILTGLLSSFAYCVHASGAILPGLLVPWMLAVAHRSHLPVRQLRALGPIGLAALVHFAGMRGIPILLRACGLIPPPAVGLEPIAGFDYYMVHFKSLRLADAAYVPTTLALEWIVPFLPASLFAFWRPRRHGTRAEVLVLLLSFIPYLGSSFLLMRVENEFGAYVLPVGLAAAMVAARCVPGRFALAGIVVALAVGVTLVRSHDHNPEGDAFAAGLRGLGHARVLVITGNASEIDAALMHQHNRQRPGFVPIEEAVLAPPPVFDRVLREYLDLGHAVFLTEAAHAFLRQEATGAILLAHIRSTYDLVAPPAGGLAGRFLQRR